MKLRRELPTTEETRDLIECPMCDAAKGEPCNNERMVQHGNAAHRASNHIERIRAARLLVQEARKSAGNRN